MSDADNQTRPMGSTGETEPVAQATPTTAPAGPGEATGLTGHSTDTADPAAWFSAAHAQPQSQSQSQEPAQQAQRPTRLPARFGTIFWGVVLLVIAGFVVANAVVPFVHDPVTWLIAGLIAAGAVLVVAGIAAAVRRAE